MTEPVRLTLLTAEGCHFCAQARAVLDRLADEWPLRVEELPLESAEGAKRALRDGVAFPPALYVDGTLFGYGRISEGKLRRRLGEMPRP